MAEISPFRGISYNRDKIVDLADVLTPPYDVISPIEQERFYSRHPKNVIRLILGKMSETDSPLNNRYTRAAKFFEQWRAEGTLVRDETPSLYVTTVDFSVGGAPFTRYGLTAKVGLEPFEKKIILPHERTFSKVKSERLELMKSCQANFSPIFGLFTETGDILRMLKESVKSEPAQSDLVDDKGHRHRMRRISDSAVCRYFGEAFRNKQLFIADGHHRYETALNYRNWLSETLPGFSGDHPANGIMMYLCSMNDPGLTILPAHRMLLGIDEAVCASLIHKATDYFQVSSFPCDASGRAALLSGLHEKTPNTKIGVFIKNQPDAYLLSLRGDVMDRLFGAEIPAALRHLDVTVLTRLVFMKLLNFNDLQLDNENSIAYSSIETEAIDAVAAGECDMAFILNPTSIDQVRTVAEQGLIMPRKSTYFYPKVITGQVLNCLKSK
jgi:uncharacterized protein (DUF1015 family)